LKKNPENLNSEQSPLEVDEILKCFNDKFYYIYKYLSKELGPVAFNVIEKCWEETKPYLSSLFQEAKVTSNGRLDISPLLKTNLIYTDQKIQLNLIRNLNELLVAEVLAVRKNLGSEHEDALVKNLEKIGEER